jgi:hypothetical protein
VAPKENNLITVSYEPARQFASYKKWCPHEESNLDLRFRKPLFTAYY